MKWITLRGRVVDVPTAKYRVDWDGDQGSRFSKAVLDWIKPYWEKDAVLAEWPVPGGNRMRFDFVNINKRLIVETDGKQHDQYSDHFHGSQSAYRAQMGRDLKKDEVALLNQFTMIRIKPEDLPLTKEWLEKTFDITL